VLCCTYKVTRSGYYGWRKRLHRPGKAQNQQLSARIAAIYDASYRIYRSHRIHWALKAGYSGRAEASGRLDASDGTEGTLWEDLPQPTTVVMDKHSRRILSWSLSSRKELG
jgi:hypothetical protein